MSLPLHKMWTLSPYKTSQRLFSWTFWEIFTCFGPRKPAITPSGDIMVQVYASGQEQNTHDGVFLCIRMCVLPSCVRCGWRLGGEEEEGEESHFPDWLWCRDSFPVVTVLESSGWGEKNMLFWADCLCFGLRPFAVNALRCTNKMLECQCYQKKLPYFSRANFTKRPDKVSIPFLASIICQTRSCAGLQGERLDIYNPSATKYWGGESLTSPERAKQNILLLFWKRK